MYDKTFGKFLGDGRQSISYDDPTFVPILVSSYHTDWSPCDRNLPKALALVFCSLVPNSLLSLGVQLLDERNNWGEKMARDQSKHSIIRKKLPKGPTGLLGRSPPGLRRSLVYLY